MSQIITPPDIVNAENSVLLVNVTKNDLEMIIHWLRLAERNITMYIYKSGSADDNWLAKVSESCDKILIERSKTESTDVIKLINKPNKIIWFGDDQEYCMAIEYFIKNDRINQNNTSSVL